MICSMSPPRLDYAREWRDFAATVEQPDQPICDFCGIRHERVAWHPYCTMARQFSMRGAMSRQDQVQVEVTPEMVEAGAEALAGYDDATASIEEYLPDVYRAMLAAQKDQNRCGARKAK